MNKYYAIIDDVYGADFYQVILSGKVFFTEEAAQETIDLSCSPLCMVDTYDYKDGKLTMYTPGKECVVEIVKSYSCTMDEVFEHLSSSNGIIAGNAVDLFIDVLGASNNQEHAFSPIMMDNPNDHRH